MTIRVHRITGNKNIVNPISGIRYPVPKEHLSDVNFDLVKQSRHNNVRNKQDKESVLIYWTPD